MGLSFAKEKNQPKEFTRQHALFEHFIEVAPGFWNYRTDFVVGKVLDVKTHMSVVQLENGKFVAIDAAFLTADAKAELDILTENGKNLIASIHTHPFHTLAIPAFHAAYPGTEERKYYGCPRHVDLINQDANGAKITWGGSLNDCSVRSMFMPDLEMRIPAGCEFVDPKPAHKNHFCGVFVFHPKSKTVVQDDTVLYIREPGFLLKVFGFGPYSMHFHPSMKGCGLYPTEEAPIEFLEWFNEMLNDWDFENLISAHNGGCYGIAKETARALITAQEPRLRKISKRNAARIARRGDSPIVEIDDDDTPDGWSENLMHTECG